MTEPVIPTYELVLIEWEDSHSGQGWRSLDEIKKECRPLYCRSVGWLVAEKNGCKIIVPHLYHENQGIVAQGCNDISIPERSITELIVLAKKCD